MGVGLANRDDRSHRSKGRIPSWSRVNVKRAVRTNRRQLREFRTHRLLWSLTTYTLETARAAASYFQNGRRNPSSKICAEWR